MIEVVNGNALKAEGVLVHQVNYLGIMGGGIALTIAREFPQVYDEYVKLCEQFAGNERNLLGTFQVVTLDPTKNKGTKPGTPIIINMFSQDDFSRNYCLTSYGSMKIAFKKIHDYAKENGYNVAVPYNIGCGIAGGDWKVVKDEIIDPIFMDSDVKITIYKLDNPYNSNI